MGARDEGLAGGPGALGRGGGDVRRAGEGPARAGGDTARRPDPMEMKAGVIPLIIKLFCQAGN